MNYRCDICEVYVDRETLNLLKSIILRTLSYLEGDTTELAIWRYYWRMKLF